MNASLLAVLNDAERLLVAQTERAELAALDEDAAIDLEARIRRARNKYVGQYRRAASVRVAEHGARGMARPENRRAAMKAEAFEEALARVSRRVAALARQAAAALRAERLAAARAARHGRGPGPQQGNVPPAGRAPRSPQSPRVTAPCARPGPRSSGPVPSLRAHVSRRRKTAGNIRPSLWHRPYQIIRCECPIHAVRTT